MSRSYYLFQTDTPVSTRHSFIRPRTSVLLPRQTVHRIFSSERRSMACYISLSLLYLLCYSSLCNRYLTRTSASVALLDRSALEAKTPARSSFPLSPLVATLTVGGSTCPWHDSTRLFPLVRATEPCQFTTAASAYWFRWTVCPDAAERRAASRISTTITLVSSEDNASGLAPFNSTARR